MAAKNNTQKIRFILVGAINTSIDFGLLFTLKSIGLPVVTANIMSTSAAFCFSFFANRKYTFKTHSSNIRRELFLFVIVTLFGLWGLQTLMISITLPILSLLHIPENTATVIAKLLATTTSLIWNYIMYSRFVFAEKKEIK